MPPPHDPIRLYRHALAAGDRELARAIRRCLATRPAGRRGGALAGGGYQPATAAQRAYFTLVDRLELR